MFKQTKTMCSFTAAHPAPPTRCAPSAPPGAGTLKRMPAAPHCTRGCGVGRQDGGREKLGTGGRWARSARTGGGRSRQHRVRCSAGRMATAAEPLALCHAHTPDGRQVQPAGSSGGAQQQRGFIVPERVQRLDWLSPLGQQHCGRHMGAGKWAACQGRLQLLHGPPNSCHGGARLSMALPAPQQPCTVRHTTRPQHAVQGRQRSVPAALWSQQAAPRMPAALGARQVRC